MRIPVAEIIGDLVLPTPATGRLAQVRAPVLLIVGGHDEVVIELNREARSLLRAASELAIVPGATTYSKNPAHSRRSHAWPANGSNVI